MPILTLASPKGGVGKSTSTLLLATTLAADGADVAVLDADRNQPLTRWADGRQLHGLSVMPAINEETFVSMLDAEAARRDAVIVDLEGAASRLVSRAIMRSDLVLIPMQASAVDAAEAGRAVSLVRQEEEILRRSIQHRVVLTRTSPQIPTRAERAILSEMTEGGIVALRTHLHERTAFKAIFAYRCTLAQLDPALVNGIAAARANAETFAGEVTALLRAIVARRAAA